MVNAGNWLQARIVAEYGRELSYEESFLCIYYELKDRMEFAMRTGKEKQTPWRVELPIDKKDWIELKRKFEETERLISQMFMRAVDSHDGDTIIKLAKAVWFFKDRRANSSIRPADRERSLLLFLKSILEQTGGKATIRAVAMFLSLDDPIMMQKWKAGDVKAPADGYSALRRKCRLLGIPIAPSRKTSRK